MSIGQFQDRTIYDFKNRLTGGGSRANLFECEMAFPTAALGGNSPLDPTATNTDFRFLVKTAQLPGSTLSTIPVPFRGRVLKIAGDRQFDQWSVTILNDTNFRLRNAFEKWSNYINRHDDNSGVITPATYQREIIVHQLSRGKAETQNILSATAPPTGSEIPILKSYKLYGCYPSSIDPIPLSYDTTDSIEEFGVTFEVQWWDAYDPEGRKLFDTSEPNGTQPIIGNSTLAGGGIENQFL